MPVLTIDPDQPISNLQEQFSRLFPFLKIDCFKSQHQKGDGSARRKMYSPETHLRSCMHGNTYGSISVNKKMTATQLEELFRKEFGLNVQVFRKSGNVWLETTATDSWTLKEQNDEGKSSMEELKEEKENAEDHDVY